MRSTGIALGFFATPAYACAVDTWHPSGRQMTIVRPLSVGIETLRNVVPMPETTMALL